MILQEELLSVTLTKFYKFLGNPNKVMDLGFTEIPEELFMEFLREAMPKFT